ncbi:protein NLRC3-like [Genypterus blacodes]|uniref:protein NLRC3-like n=1 Tax=Genypterus blacodes TaxID=154954 RepID=UPI003F76A8A4
MTAPKTELWKTLECLTEADFKAFRWVLQDLRHEGFRPIPAAKLGTADRMDTVELLRQNYQEQTVEVTNKVLHTINRNDLVERLSSYKDPMEAAQTLPQPITVYQRKLQTNLKHIFKFVEEGWTERKDKKHLDCIFTELYITDGSDIHINTQHEVMQTEMKWKPIAEEKPIQLCNIFKHPNEEGVPIRTVLTNGIAGIGKSFLVRKFVLDWTKGRTNQDVHLTFPFTFRELNLWSGKSRTLVELIHQCIQQTVCIEVAALNNIFTALQTSGSSDYGKSEFKLLFVLDGLDESRLDLAGATLVDSIDVTKSMRVETLLKNLIEGNLLPSARIWITTRPAAVNQIPPHCVDMVTEVRGFTDPQKEEYFRKRFRDDKQASSIISHIKTSQSLHIMCHIPVFCWITATVLEDRLKTRKTGELPKTLTEMYTEFLVFQIFQTKKKYEGEKNIQYICSLAKLAYEQLEKGNLIFYEKDLNESGINFSEASVYSGVFTMIFKEERGRKKHMFSFVHLSVHEFLAALHVVLSLINSNKNVMTESQNISQTSTKEQAMTEVHRIAINKALQSPNGHLDLFLRFLLGLSLQTNQEQLRDLLLMTGSYSWTNLETIKYIKIAIETSISAERSINLFHCLNELNDYSLVKEIQSYLKSKKPSAYRISPSQHSALVSISQSSEQRLKEFDLRNYCASEEALLSMLPRVEASSKAVLSACNLSGRGCEALAAVLSSQSSSLRDLDLSCNNLEDSGVELLCAGLLSPHCCLETLSLSDCSLTERSCGSLSSVLSAQPSSLRKLDLSDNDLQDSGVKLLCSGLANPNCALKTLRLSRCLITETGCVDLALSLRANFRHLRELDLTCNDLGDGRAMLQWAGRALASLWIDPGDEVESCICDLKKCTLL